MSVSRWEPLKDFMTLRQAMDRLFEDSIVRPTRMWQESQGTRHMPLDIWMTNDAIVVRAEIAGAQPENVEISIEGSTLTIRGEIPPPPEEERTFLLQENRYGAFSRTVELGIAVQPEKAEALFKNGVLLLTIPKAEELKPKVIKVKTG